MVFAVAESIVYYKANSGEQQGTIDAEVSFAHDAIIHMAFTYPIIPSIP